jgi:hypothetical protein
MDYRVILFHKQATSARLRFLRFGHGSVCAFESIPPLAQAHAGRQGSPAMHPAQVVRRLEQELGFESGSLHAEEGYRYVVEVPGAAIQVLLVAIGSTDPPFEAARKIDAEFIDLTQARELPPVELELLRGAYELVLGG